jgi:hypothetical protein
MPPCYDIYVCSNKRDKKTIERFLNHFANRKLIEDQSNCEIFIAGSDKYNIDESSVKVNSLTQILDFGIAKKEIGFAYYISNNLDERINHIILKFTFDAKIIFGISIETKRIAPTGNLLDNYKQALTIEQEMCELSNSIKSSIQVEYAPSDDEKEFEEDKKLWNEMNVQKSLIFR